MLGSLPNWLQALLSLALLGFVVVLGTRVTSAVTRKVV